MDSDDEIMRRKEEEMNKMRADSASPSTISTASSGSPLVRGSSSSSHQFSSKRPPPTSIAAAQLQCQQQLEFINNNISNSSRSAYSGPRQANKSEGSSASSKRSKSQGQQHKAEKNAVGGTGDSQSNNKSLGYNLAKSIAYRAYRFNEFWSLNKMRYLNFACLLMTLVCLITIIVFSSNNNNQAGSLATAANSNNDMMRFSKVKPLETASEDDSPSSQPMVRNHQVSGEQDIGSDSSDDMEDFRRLTKFRRKSEPAENSGEREPDQDQQVDGFTMDSLTSEQDQQQQPANMMMFNELQDPIGSLLKSIRKAANSTNSKPIVRRTKNGVTIIISSSLNESSSALAGGQNGSLNGLPSLLEKLLPPFLRPPMRSQLGDGLASATISIGAEPMFASGSFLSPSNGRFLDSPSLFSSFNRPPHQRFYMEPMRAPQGGPMFGPTMFPLAVGPMPLPPPSLLSMLMRPQLQEQDFDQDYPPQQVVAPKATSTVNNATLTKNETLNTQASQQQVVTTSLTANNSTTNSSQPSVKPEASKSDPEVELFDVLQSRPPPPTGARFFHNLYGARGPRLPHTGSMLLFSSGNLAPERASDPMPFGSPHFVAMPPPVGPHMVLLGGAESSHQPESVSPMNPVLRSILSNVMSELGGTESSLAAQSNSSVLPQAKRSLATPNWAAWSQGEPDDEWTVGGGQSSSSEPAQSLDRWDSEQMGSAKQLRSRHRDEEMLDSASMDASDFLTGFQQMGTGQDSLFGSGGSPAGQQAAIVSGTIRQTIRGPGVSVERIIELPGSRQQPQVVPTGIKSQSLSRVSDSVSSESLESPMHDMLVPPVRSMFQQASQREDRDEREFAVPHFGFIGKLLSDISASAARHHHQQQHQHQQRNHNEQQKASNSFNMMKHARAMHSSSSFQDDLDEGDSSDSVAPSRSWPAKIRVASARIRMKPALMVTNSEPRSDSSSSSAFFVAPSHFTMPANEASSRTEAHVSRVEMQPNKVSGFDESLKSMEDRISQVLSMAHQSSSVSKAQRSTAEQEEPNFTTIEVDNKSSDSSAPINLVNRPTGENNPFTSPLSPLFGFPSSSGVAPPKPVSSQEDNSAMKPVIGGHRQPRSFTYHSNHEIASNMQKNSDQQVVISNNHKTARSSDEFMPFSAPPAGIVMGRRLDDAPVGEQENQDGVDSITEAKDAETKNLAEERQQNYKTIVV